MDFYSYFSFFAAIIYVYLGLYAFALDKKSPLNRAFILMCSAVAFKSFFAVMVYNSTIVSECLYWHKIADVGWTLFPAAALTFFMTLTDAGHLLSNKAFIFYVYSPWIIFNFKSYTGAIDSMVAFKPSDYYGFHTFNNSSPNAIDLYFVVYSAICIYFLYKWMKTNRSNRAIKQSAVLLAATAATLAAGIVTDIALPLTNFKEVPLMAHITILIWFFGVWYAISHYKLMTLTPAVLSEEIISGIMDFVVITNPGYAITFVNGRVCDVCGMSANELIGRGISELVDMDISKTSFLAGVKNFKTVETFESRLKTVVNGDIPIKIVLTSIYDEWKDLKGYVFCASDERLTKRLEFEIQEQNKVEKELFLSKLKYQQLVNSLPQIVFETDVSGCLTFVNRAAYDFFKYDKFDFDGGLNVIQMIHPSDVERAVKNMAEIVSLKRPPDPSGREYLMMRKDNTTFPAVVHSYLMITDNRPSGICGIIVDITELKNARERLEKINDELDYKVKERTAELALTNEKLKNEIIAREKMEADIIKAAKIESLGIIAGGIAHDFNNMLMGILGNLSLLRTRVENDVKAIEMIKRAEEVSFKAKTLTMQLLTFSKDNKPLTRPVIIGDMLKNTVSFTLRGSNVNCRFYFEKDLPCAEIDEGQMNQVFTNLAINAMQAMPSSGGLLEISAGNFEVSDQLYLPLKNGRYVKITFKDNGAGISAQDLPKLFDPYFTTKSKGTGLGLTSAFAIVRKHGGIITVDSKPGEGAAFCLYLPISSASGAAALDDDDEPVKRLSGRALLLDDEVFIREAVGEILTTFGMSVDCCKDGSEAIELYKKSMNENNKYDILIFDLTIPGGMGGVETIEKIKALDANAVAIASSGYYSGSVRSDYNKLGFKAFLAKPYKIEELYRLIKKIMSAEMVTETQKDAIE